MNKIQKKRLTIIVSIFFILSLAIGLVLFALKQNINLFYTPTELQQANINSDQVVRIGGYVKKNSVEYDKSGQGVSFIVTDNKNDLAVTYHGILPSLFREGQGVVVEGKVNSAHVLAASEVLAKHDEKYMPKVLEKSLAEKNPT